MQSYSEFHKTEGSDRVKYIFGLQKPKPLITSLSSLMISLIISATMMLYTQKMIRK